MNAVQPAVWRAAVDSAAYFVHLALVLVPLFVGASFLVGLAQEYLPPERVGQVLRGHDEGAGNVAAAGFGAVTPFCSCSTVPVLAGLLRAGAPLGLAFSFLLASPLVNEVAVVLLLGVFGLEVTVWYVATTFTAAVVGGLVVGRLGLGDHVKEIGRPSGERGGVATDGGTADCGTADGDSADCGTGDGGSADCGTADGGSADCGTGDGGSTDCGTGDGGTAGCGTADGGSTDCGGVDREAGSGDDVRRTHRQRVGAAAGEAWSFLRESLAYLVLGLVAGALIHGAVPVAVVQAVLGPSNPFAVPLAALAGAPVYVSMSGMLGIAAALGDQGVPTGTVLAFVVGGAGVSVPNLVLLNKLFDRRLLLVYAATVVTIGIVVGLLFNAVFV
jgi:uncharacterized membrane protein YraQ (UPF0718 family)